MLATVLFQWTVFVSVIYGFRFVEGNEPSRCSWPQFTCNDGTCIHFRRWCDTRMDCNDGSDELYCAKTTELNDDPNKCGLNFFKCKDGPCIPIEGRCDNFPSCRDYSDENDCYSSTVSKESTFLETQASNNTSSYTTTSYDIQNFTQSDLAEYRTDVTTQAYDITPPSTENYTFLSGFPPSTAPVHQEMQNMLNTSPNENQVDLNSIDRVSIRESKPKLVLEPELPTAGFQEMNVEAFNVHKSKAQEWLLSRHDADFGWGEETSRALTALTLSGLPSLFNGTESGILMKKQLHLQLSVALSRNLTNPMTLSDLGLYINALLATCSNPRNFHGVDLIQIFRQRVDTVQNTGYFVSPLIYLTLCVCNATSYLDLIGMEEFHSSTNPALNSIGFQAMVALAATCTARMPKFTDVTVSQDPLRKLLRKVSAAQLPENVYELALLVQALNEAQIDLGLWERTRAMTLILDKQHKSGSFGDLLSTYYVLPVLSGRSLVSLRTHCDKLNTGLIPSSTQSSSKLNTIYVQFSLYFGNPVEVSHTIQLKVANGSKLLDIMQMSAKIDPIYEFQYDASQALPFVYSIGGVANDVERGLYWMLYFSRRNESSLSTGAVLELYTGDFRHLIPEPDNNLIFWRRIIE